MKFILLVCTNLVLAWLFGPVAIAQGNSDAEWPAYGRDAGNTRYSPLKQINRDNVARLKVAWVFHTGDISGGHDGRGRSGFETTPIMVDGLLFLTTPFNRVVALDPETGQQRWSYDPKVDLTLGYGDGLINRGVATWLDKALPAGKPCRRRIFEETLDARLIALDAATGMPCAGFGQKGEVSLKSVSRYHTGWYHMTSPPAVIDDMAVVGSAIDDNARADMPDGVVRAYDTRSGELRWSWNPIPANGTAEDPPGAWRSGAANAWSILSVDPVRDLVFVPTGSASPDYYGGLRPGDDKWADSVVALHAQTGKIAWGFQLVHHDLWDYDTAPPPLLTTIIHNGSRVDAVIEGNKTGFIYTLNRATGVPLFPVEERPVPQSDVHGEATSATQPIPAAPPALAPQRISPDQLWGPTPADREQCSALLKGMRNEGVFTPPSLRGTLAIPGNIGGLNWSGYAFDPMDSLLIVNTSNLPFQVTLVPPGKEAAATANELRAEYGSQLGAPYAMMRRPFMSAARLPCSAPPWGTLSAVDMVKGEIRWQVPLGTMNVLAPGNRDLPEGSISFGGPIVTAGGLVFIAGTLDSAIRGFDISTGRELWKFRLPAGGHATPMTYQAGNGRQYLVIAAGGHAKITEEGQSDAVIAFDLPQDSMSDNGYYVNFVRSNQSCTFPLTSCSGPGPRRSGLPAISAIPRWSRYPTDCRPVWSA